MQQRRRCAVRVCIEAFWWVRRASANAHRLHMQMRHFRFVLSDAHSYVQSALDPVSLGRVHQCVSALGLLGGCTQVHTVLSVLSTLLSRKHEFQADAFACELNYGEQLKEALCTIHTENKSTLDPDPWSVTSASQRQSSEKPTQF